MNTDLAAENQARLEQCSASAANIAKNIDTYEHAIQAWRRENESLKKELALTQSLLELSEALRIRLKHENDALKQPRLTPLAQRLAGTAPSPVPYA